MSLKPDHRFRSVTLRYERMVVKRQLGYDFNEIAFYLDFRQNKYFLLQHNISIMFTHNKSH
jgi:hypothetical protein